MQKTHTHLSHYVTSPIRPMWAFSNPRGYVVCLASTHHTYIYIYSFLLINIYACFGGHFFVHVGPVFFASF